MAPRTRLQTEQGKLKLLQLPDGCLEKIVSLAAQGSWKERCRLAEVCRTFRGLFDAQAYAGRPLHLNLNSLSWRLAAGKGRPAARRALLGLLTRVAPSVRDLRIRYQMDGAAGLSLEALLAPLAPHVQRLEVEDGLCAPLLRTLGRGWDALQEVLLLGANLWIDFEAGELARLERQLSSMPALAAKIVHFEGSCQGMPEGEETFFRHLTNLRSLELEDWAVWDLPRDYSPLHTMPHLTRLTLNIVEELESNMPALLSLTQVSELSLLGCYRASRGLAQLSNLVQLDLQPGLVMNANDDEEPEPEAGAAWKCRHLTELRWCGDLTFDAGDNPVDLPRLVSLEVDECYFPPEGFPLALCLTQLTNLRLVGGRCTRLPPAISQLQCLQVLAIDSCPLPAVPPSISCLTAVTNLQLANTQLKAHLPAWVLGLPIRKLWLSNNQLHNLLPARGGNAARKEEWLARLTHVCMSSNALRELPKALLEHGAALVELDVAYNHALQIGAKTANAVAEMPSLRLLRLEKSYWLRLEDRWSQASLRAIKRLQERRPDVQIDFQHQALPGGIGFRRGWPVPAERRWCRRLSVAHSPARGMPLLHEARLEQGEEAEKGEGCLPFLDLPEELHLGVLARLPAKDLVAALASCKSLASLAPAACLAACHYRSPAWAAAARAEDTQAAADSGSAGGAGGTGVPWSEQLKWMRLKESEVQLRGLASAAAIRTLQPVINSKLRAILVHWLVELSMKWKLDSQVIFKAVEYLDCIMSQRDAGSPARFQLLGCACLRLAMTHAAYDPFQLDAERFAYMTAGAYTAAQVEAETEAIEGEIPDHLIFSRSSRHLMQSLWRRLVAAASDVNDGDMFVYNLACFLLHLSLISAELSCDYPPSLLACCALSASLAFFGKPAWPPALLRVFGYEQSQLAPGIERLLHLQATLSDELPAVHLRSIRRLWKRICRRDAQAAEGNGEQWQRLVQLVGSPSRMQLGGAAA